MYLKLFLFESSKFLIYYLLASIEAFRFFQIHESLYYFLFIIVVNFFLFFTKISSFKKCILSVDFLILFIILCLKPDTAIFYLVLSIVTSFLFFFEIVLKTKLKV